MNVDKIRDKNNEKKNKCLQEFNSWLQLIINKTHQASIFLYSLDQLILR